ncbi:MAG: hypothetical protein H8F28_09620, partial [Fibrella sp.]|nr:hypothetical protein [Armatimonadota bacterium]
MLRDSLVWCLDCRALRSAEELPTAESFERRIEALRQNRLEEYEIEIVQAIGEAEWIAEKLAEATAGLRWRRERCSPPRCLECGSTDFVPIPMLFDDEEMEHFIHPDCGGNLIRTGGMFARESGYPLYDGEGKRL